MFSRNGVTGVVGGKIRTSSPTGNNSGALAISAGRNYQEHTSPIQIQAATQLNASVGGIGMSAGSHNMSTASLWTSQFQYYMSGLIPGEPGYSDTSSLALFYRDCYLYDNVAGSAVDIQSTFPFSDYDLRGLETKELEIYTDALDQLNINRMFPEISTAYLVDGFFCGSLVFDTRTKRFTDTLIHDALQCNVMPAPFYNMMPEIRVQVGQSTLNFLNSDSPYTKQYKTSLPQSFVDMLQQGGMTLNPVSTMFVARKSLTDRAYVSFLHRILPMYLIEKTMFRGTLVEAGRRQRAMTHVTAGDDLWTPTGEELAAIVNQFQAAEFDPLGGWITTRAGVSATDVRPGGDFWKWTDMADTLVPYKLRALGISESFLSGDASYASAESAYSTFLETMNSYRNHMTQSIFYSTLFPLIAVANGLYKDPANKADSNRISDYLLNAKNRANLKIPRVMWHKSLEAQGEENTFEMLEQASEKGVPIPLKNWMAAAQLDSDALLRDLEEDKELRKKLEQYTGKDTSHEGEDEQGDIELEASMNRPTTQSLNAGARNRKAILSRDFGDNGDSYTIGKTGNKKWVHNSRTKQREETQCTVKCWLAAI